MYRISEDKRSRESSAWIYEALERLLHTMTYKDIRVTDLCKEAKIGRVTFYRHYDTIDDVLRRKCDEKFDGLIVYLFQYRRNHPGPIFFLKPFLQYWYENPAVLQCIFKADRASILSESLDSMMNKLKANIRLKHPASPYAGYFFALRSAIPLAVLAEWVKNGMNIPPDELSDTLYGQLQEIIKFNQMG